MIDELGRLDRRLLLCKVANVKKIIFRIPKHRISAHIVNTEQDYYSLSYCIQIVI